MYWNNINNNGNNNNNNNNNNIIIIIAKIIILHRPWDTLSCCTKCERWKRGSGDIGKSTQLLYFFLIFALPVLFLLVIYLYTSVVVISQCDKNRILSLVIISALYAVRFFDVLPRTVCSCECARRLGTFFFKFIVIFPSLEFSYARSLGQWEIAAPLACAKNASSLFSSSSISYFLSHSRSPFLSLYLSFSFFLSLSLFLAYVEAYYIRDNNVQVKTRRSHIVSCSRLFPST